MPLTISEVGGEKLRARLVRSRISVGMKVVTSGLWNICCFILYFEFIFEFISIFYWANLHLLPCQVSLEMELEAKGDFSAWTGHIWSVWIGSILIWSISVESILVFVRFVQELPAVQIKLSSLLVSFQNHLLKEKCEMCMADFRDLIGPRKNVDNKSVTFPQMKSTKSCPSESISMRHTFEMASNLHLNFKNCTLVNLAIKREVLKTWVASKSSSPRCLQYKSG